MENRWLHVAGLLLFSIPAALPGATAPPGGATIAEALLPAPCARTTEAGLSTLAAEVLQNIRNTGGAFGQSPVPSNRIVSFCNKFDSAQITGPNIFAAARDMVALADHEVDMAFYKWEPDADGVRMIGEGLITAQARRTTSDPLLVRIVIDDVEELSLGRPINHLWDSQKMWMNMGLDPRKVILQFATCPRFSFASANLHDKFILVDAKRLLVTGANPEPVHNAPAPWHDAGYVLQGAVGQSALAAFEHTWINDTYHWECQTEALSNDCDKLDHHYPQPSRPWMPAFGAFQPGDIPILAVGRVKEDPLGEITVTNNTNNPQDIAWMTLMNRAASYIDIITPNINDDDFRNTVVYNVKRGVTVRLLTSLGFNQKTTDAPFQGGDNEEVIGDLRHRVQTACAQDVACQNRFQVRWYSPNATEPTYGNGASANHAKYMSVDGRVAIVGSGNMETPAWNWSHEFNVLIDDANTTNYLEGTVFTPAWNRSIGMYAELFEGNGGAQNLVCPVSLVSSKSEKLFYNSLDFTTHPTACSNDEARSVVLHDVPAGKVLRFYDNSGYLYQDDDWTEIVVKRALTLKTINSFEASFEDADVRVIAHRDDGLDGKASAMDVATAAIGPVVDLYEGNSGTQNLVCSNRVTGTRTINLTQDSYCGNDEARSLKLYDFPTDKVLFVYDDSGGGTGDDWALIVPQRAIKEATVNTFESSVTTADVRVCAFYRDNLDGKVSRVRIGALSEAYGLCGVTPPPPPSCTCPEGACTPVTAAYISHFTGADCAGQESYYTPYYSDTVRRSWDGKGCAGTTLRTVTNRSWKGTNGVCNNSWPTGNTLSGFVSIYRSSCNCGEASCQPVTAAYISHFTGAGCTGEEYYYTPYFSSDGIRRSWNGTGCVGTILRTVTTRSWKSSTGVCTDAWPNGNTLSNFVRIYR